MQNSATEQFKSGERLRRWHWIGRNCRGDLKDSRLLLKAMLAGIQESGATARSQVIEQFLPHGVTLVVVLSESHFVVSTWPEFDFVSIDVSICSDSVSIEQLTQPLLSLLAAGTTESDLQTTVMSRSKHEILVTG